MDGFKCDPDKDETYGVFTNDFMDARHPDLLEDMISVGPPPGTVVSYKEVVVMKSNFIELKKEIEPIKRAHSEMEKKE